MTMIRGWFARVAFRIAVGLAPAGSQAQAELQRVVTALGSGGVGPWRPR